MAYSGKITFEGDPEAAKASLGEALKFASIVENKRELLGVAHHYGTRDLTGGGYAIVVSNGDYHAMHMVLPTPAPEEVPPEFPEEEYQPFVLVPDFLSGVVIFPQLDAESTKVVDPKDKTLTKSVTLDKLRKIKQTALSNARFTDDEARLILATPEYPTFTPLRDSPDRFSQYDTIRPGKYSGAMRTLVQLGLGLGLHILPSYEMKWIEKGTDREYLVLPLTNSDGDAEDTVSGFPQHEFLANKPTNYTQIKYDYRANRTHGVTFAGKQPCIVEISSKGIFAYPLFVDPVSQTEEGKKRYLELYPELEKYFDLFGGMPVFNSFADIAETKTFDGRENAKRAGELIVLQASGGEFYSGKMPFFSSCGWAFNDIGSEAHNTCYSYEDGYAVGFHYAANIRLSVNTPPELSNNHTDLVKVLGDKPPPMLVRKVLRLKETEFKAVYKKLTGAKTQKEVWERFDAYQVETPTLTGSATIRQQRKGKFFHAANPYPPTGFTSHPQIKFPEEILGVLLSFDFRPTDPKKRWQPVACDTPMFAFYNGGALEVVYYYHSLDAGKPFEPVNDQQECQISGTWTEATGGLSTLAGVFYTSRVDHRKIVTQGTSTKTTTQRKIGEQTYAQQHAPFSMCIDVSASTLTAVSYESTSVGETGYSSSLAIPRGERNMLLMAEWDTRTNVQKSSGGGGGPSYFGGTTDTYVIWNFIFHWVGCGIYGDIRTTAKKFRTSTVEVCAPLTPKALQYSITKTALTSNCGDGKSIIGSCVIGGSPPNISSWSTPPVVHEKEIDVRVYAWLPGDLGHMQILTKSEHGEFYLIDPTVAVSSWWVEHSPDAYGNYASQLRAQSNCAGTESTTYDPDFDAETTKSTPTISVSLPVTATPFGVIT